METIMMQLGPFQFGLSTAAYQEFTRRTEYRWPGQARLNKLDARQFTGKGSDSITLTGTVYPEFRGGTEQIEDMRSTAELGIPLIMVDGRGNVLGFWVIESIEEKGSIFAEAGVARKQDFTIQIQKYDDDDAIL